jgi:hypothetical protein
MAKLLWRPNCVSRVGWMPRAMPVLSTPALEAVAAERRVVDACRGGAALEVQPWRCRRQCRYHCGAAGTGQGGGAAVAVMWRHPDLLEHDVLGDPGGPWLLAQRAPGRVPSRRRGPPRVTPRRCARPCCHLPSSLLSPTLVHASQHTLPVHKSKFCAWIARHPSQSEALRPCQQMLDREGALLDRPRAPLVR